MDVKAKTKLLQRLESEKKRLIGEINSIEQTGKNLAMADSLGELSSYDNHPADIGDELFERSKDIALEENSKLLLIKVNKAIEKIQSGQYGYCENCGQPIQMERLEVIPWADKCISCQKTIEHNDVTPRPLEEEVLSPPFHRTFLDSVKSENVAFDGEDALQSVLKFGSSDSPQDIPGCYDYKALFPNSNEHQGIVDRTDAIPARKTKD